MKRLKDGKKKDALFLSSFHFILKLIFLAMDKKIFI